MPVRLKYLGPAIAICAVVAWADAEEAVTLSRIVTQLESLHRVTAVPHRMADSTVVFCAPFGAAPASIHEGHIGPAYCHVYVTADAKEPMVSGHGVYPRGSVIIKAKLESEKSSDALLYTVMRKMEEGYDRKNGDWEYSVLEGSSHRVLARGKIDSCIECHEQHASTDYVTRAYIK